MINSHIYSLIGLVLIAYVNPLTHSSTVPLQDAENLELIYPPTKTSLFNPTLGDQGVTTPASEGNSPFISSEKAASFIY
jgi:hypothetical protein